MIMCYWNDLIKEWQALESEAATWPNAAQVAARFGRSRQSGSTWCRRGLFERDGMIGAVKLDGVWRINPAALEGFTPPVERAGAGRKRKG
jgi:hypothetical protein